MKQIIKLLTVTFLLSTQIQAQTWTTHNASTVDLITNISFPSNDTGYVLDEFGLIKRTTNGAISWTNVPTPPTLIYSLIFITGQTGFTIGDSTIYKTTNGGTTWIPVLSESEVYFTRIFFANSSTGYACCETFASDSVRLYKTSNGGNNWTRIATKEFFPADQGLYFINPTTGFWSVNANIFATSNGGSSFSSVYNDVTQSQYYTNFSFPNVDTGYAVEVLTLLRTVDGGASWSSITYPGLLMYDLYFSTGKKGFICGGNGINSGFVSQTSDAGASWTPSYTSSTTFVCMDFPSDTVGYVGGFNGTVLKFAGTITDVVENSIQHVVSIYPNPANESVSISNLIPDSKISLLNLSGQIIVDEIAGNSTQQMNLENIATGIYFIQVENAGEKTIRKLIVE